MRTTLDIDEDILMAIKDLARRQNKTMGEVMSDLARRAITAPEQSLRTESPKAIYGVRPFPKRGGVVTNELVNKLREDDVY